MARRSHAAKKAPEARPRPGSDPTRLSLAMHGLFFLSGIAGIGYQLLWTRMFAVGLGHEAPSMLAVVAGFFGGLAVGAWGLDRAVSRSPRPGLWYAAMELVIGAWGVVTSALIPTINGRAAAWLGQAPSPLKHWLIAFALPLIVMLPATAAMGGTLPAVDRMVQRLSGRVGLGGLYGANTFGAVCGVLLSTFALVPAFGLRAGLYLLGALNLACALVTWTIQSRLRSSTTPAPVAAQGVDERLRPAPRRETDAGKVGAPTPGSVRLLSTLFVTGFLGIGYEILSVVTMSQVLQNTIYTFALALSVYLCGTAAGAALHPRMWPRPSYAEKLRMLLGSLAVCCLIGTLALAAAPRIQAGAASVLGRGFLSGLAAEAVLAGAVLILPTVAMGATFTHLCVGVRHASGGVGAALGLNTLGGFLAPVVFGVLLLPGIGPKSALIVSSLSYLLLLPGLAKRWSVLPVVAAVLAVFVVFANLDHVDPPAGGRTVELRSGILGAVAVVADDGGHRFLKIDNRFIMGGTAATFPDRRLMLVPMLLHPGPRRALVLGVGTGVTIGETAADPRMQTDGVELVGDVLRVMHHFEPENQFPDRLGNVTLWNADARRFVRSVHASYDLIVADLFHPARDGAGSLYTREHFEAIRERLAPGGLFVQWLPLHQMDLSVFSIVCRTFLEVFPDGRAIVAHFNSRTPVIGLVGTEAAAVLPPAGIEARLRADPMRAAARDLGIESAEDVLGCIVADAGSLQAFADAHSRASDVNTDDRPIVTLRAPRYTYDDAEPPAHRLDVLLAAASVDAGRLTGDPAWSERLGRFWRARDLFIGAAEAGSVSRERGWSLLLDAVRTSHDFRPAYAEVMSEAITLARTDGPGAIALLDRLIQAEPSRPEAMQLERQILERTLQ